MLIPYSKVDDMRITLLHHADKIFPLNEWVTYGQVYYNIQQLGLLGQDGRVYSKTAANSWVRVTLWLVALIGCVANV